jgi:hypothetical protein
MKFIHKKVGDILEVGARHTVWWGSLKSEKGSDRIGQYLSVSGRCPVAPGEGAGSVNVIFLR